ncbi:MAG: site-specific DNA-methyltransferase [Actinomycetales bacterium]|nr:site-specific DNA-methyltransferase [Actinomycetales bacterium]
MERAWDAEAWLAERPAAAIVRGDNIAVTAGLPDGVAALVYLDPPFNTGRRQSHRPLRAVRDEDGDRVGFGGVRYRSEHAAATGYGDRFEDYVGFLRPRLEQARRLLDERGTLYLHLDYREAHYAKVELDALFGRECFLNELIWAYDYGGKATRRWPAKHDTILVYVKDPASYRFDSAAVDREPYMAPGLVTPEKAARGKLPTDVWWHTIVPTNSRERTGYPTQKPEGVLRRIVQASSEPGDLVVDLFAGSGTTGAVATALGRRALLVDESPQALEVMRRRLPGAWVAEAEPPRRARRARP